MKAIKMTITREHERYDDYWWHLVIFGDLWWLLVIFHGEIWWFIVTSWWIMIFISPSSWERALFLFCLTNETFMSFLSLLLPKSHKIMTFLKKKKKKKLEVFFPKKRSLFSWVLSGVNNYSKLVHFLAYLKSIILNTNIYYNKQAKKSSEYVMVG